MQTFEEFYEKRKMNLVEFWGKLIAEPISAEEFAYCIAKQYFKQYNEGAKDALEEAEGIANDMRKSGFCDDCDCILRDSLEEAREKIDYDFTYREYGEYVDF